ncbi:anti-sigma B factor antagonist [Nonomuraea solani]|uniref:Anti-sigma factor antagonist n=1 Tax=Nonomuraea solani TaxID=1144553 RepID=A0A1H6EG14_9ACTN|nr:STAS domain-containing protein [Nonomuraea solani]SEG96768.1 anti-sigma B factor antagonist [Nonomuraea solani]
MGSVDRTGFSWVVTQSDDAAVMSVMGELDLASVIEFRRGLGQAMANPTPPLVIVDLAAVDFCDSSGLNTLIWAANTVEAAHGHLVLSGTQPRLTRLLRMTGLHKRFRTCESVAAASELLSSPDR